MFFRQYELGCLSLYSYLIGDETTGRAVVVDPQRDVGQYLEDAQRQGLTIERVIETHFHADFLSGHLELAAATGAKISYATGAKAEFAIDPLDHGQRLALGSVVLEIRHTPGHTPESLSIVVWEHDTDAEPWGVLTGDALFIGDVGRPDLLTAAGVSADDLARQLYRSLHEQLMTLPDATRVFPAHGAGSACGKNLSSAPQSTIGEQRRTNYALAPMSEDDFVHAVTEGQPVAPLYFAFSAAANRRERELLGEDRTVTILEPDDALRIQADGAVLLDVRAPEEFAAGHLAGSVNVGIDGRFAEYAGDLLRPGDRVVLVAHPDRADEARVRLARIGFDNVVGALVDVAGALQTHPELAQRAPRLEPDEVRTWQEEEPLLQVVDVRNPSEHAAGALDGARNLPLATLLDRYTELDPALPTLVYCAGGHRSSAGASLLRSRGFTAVADVVGGYGAVCATTTA